jgi:hypothetical protein
MTETPIAVVATTQAAPESRSGPKDQRGGVPEQDTQ